MISDYHIRNPDEIFTETINQYVHLNAHFNQLKGLYSVKIILIVKNISVQLADILNIEET